MNEGVKSREEILEPKSKESHSVHAPYFPEVPEHLPDCSIHLFRKRLTWCNSKYHDRKEL